MKRFKFSLEPLLILREQNERTAQQRHAKALVARDAAEAELRTAIIRLAEGWEDLAREQAAGVSAGKIMGTRAWCLMLEIQKHERAAALLDARQIAERTLKAMLEARREREGLNRFRDKSYRAHAYAFRREEQKSYDEMAGQSSRLPGLLELASHENSHPA